MRPKSDKKAALILTAVRQVLAKQGYSGTTINAVATEAGVSRGLIHYYFASKDQMLAQVLKDNMTLSTRMVQRLFDRDLDPDGYARGMVEMVQKTIETDPAFFHLFFESFAVARQSPVVSKELTSLYDLFRNALEQGLARAAQNRRISPALPLKPLAAVITGLIDGMALQLVTEPDLFRDPEIWEAMIQSIEDLLTTG